MHLPFRLLNLVLSNLIKESGPVQGGPPGTISSPNSVSNADPRVPPSLTSFAAPRQSASRKSGAEPQVGGWEASTILLGCHVPAASVYFVSLTCARINCSSSPDHDHDRETVPPTAAFLSQGAKAALRVESAAKAARGITRRVSSV